MSDHLPPAGDDFDERAREAGRALRSAAPADGLRRIEAGRRNRRIARAGGALVGTAVVVGALALIVGRAGDDTTVATVPPAPTTPASPEPTTPTAPTSTSSPASTPSTAPAVPTVPGAGVDPPGSEAPARPRPPAGTSVWVGSKLAGFFDDDGFVAVSSPADVPDGMLGTPIELTGAAGHTATATPTDAGCADVYLEPAPAQWDVYLSGDARLEPAPSAAQDHVDAIARALGTFGFTETQPQFTPREYTPDGSADALIVVNDVDGVAPIWIATWDDATDEFTTLEGDPAGDTLDIGAPVPAEFDLDGDGFWEIAYAVGDAWVIRELGTGDTIAAGSVIPCPDGSVEQPPAPTGPEALLGEWSFDDDGVPDLFVRFDDGATFATYGGCFDEVTVADAAAALRGATPDCLGDGADPRLADLHAASLTGAALTVDGAGRLVVGDAALELVRVMPPDGLDLDRGAAFGYYAGQYVSNVESMIDVVSTHLGEPSHDTGWFVTPPPASPDEPDCLADMTTRSIWWGDLAISIWPAGTNTAAGTIWNWTLGATPTDINVFADEPYTPAPLSIGTVDGFAVGTPVEAVPDVFGERFHGWSAAGDGSEFAGIDGWPTQNFFGNFALITARDGLIESLGAQKSFC